MEAIRYSDLASVVRGVHKSTIYRPELKSQIWNSISDFEHRLKPGAGGAPRSFFVSMQNMVLDCPTAPSTSPGDRFVPTSYLTGYGA